MYKVLAPSIINYYGLMGALDTFTVCVRGQLSVNGLSACTFLYCACTYLAADPEGVQLAVEVNIATVDALEDKEDVSQES